RQSSVGPACKACVEFQWEDAVPTLRDAIAGPRHLRELETMIRARRTLEGKPIPQELINAGQTMRGVNRRDRDPELENRIDKARRLLIETGDAEGANMAALSLALMSDKG